MALITTWAALLLAGVAGLGLGLGLVIGAEVVRSLRAASRDDGQHRSDE